MLQKTVALLVIFFSDDETTQRLDVPIFAQPVNKLEIPGNSLEDVVKIARIAYELVLESKWIASRFIHDFLI